MQRDTKTVDQMALREPDYCGECQDFDDLCKEFVVMDEAPGQREKTYILLNAMRRCHVDCVNACLAAGADVNIKVRHVTQVKCMM